MGQSTIARRVVCRGSGLHGGKEAGVSLEPADPDTGIVFLATATRPAAQDRLVPTGRDPAGRPDRGRVVEIPARAEFVRSSSRATTLALPESVAPLGPRVTTVEHLLASLFAFGIDNVRIGIEGDEIPVMDGSAGAFVALLTEAGRVDQSAPRRSLGLRQAIEIRDGERWIRAEPSDVFRVSYSIEFPHPCIGRQIFELPCLDAKIFESELAHARTFGFASEVAALRDAGLARGGSLDNAVVLDETGVLNPGGLRWPDEFVRHKVVDLLGDMALLCGRLRARIVVEKGGHGLHHRLVRALIDSPHVFEIDDQTVAA